MIRYRRGNDIKVQFATPTDIAANTPFEAVLWTTKRSINIRATYDGETQYNCVVNGRNVTIATDNPPFADGVLLAEITYHITDAEMPDGVRNLRLPIELTNLNADFVIQGKVVKVNDIQPNENCAIYHAGSDIKVRIDLSIDGHAASPTDCPFEVRIWRENRADAIVAGWDGVETYGSVFLRDGHIIISADNPGWTTGQLKAEVTMYYPDGDMADFSQKVITPICLSPNNDGYTGEGGYAHEIVGLSAYDIAVKHGFVGTESEWLASLAAHGKSESRINIEPETSILHTAVFKRDTSELVVNGVRYFKGITYDENPIVGMDTYSNGLTLTDGLILLPTDIVVLSADFNI